ncbi:transketolase [Pseudomonas sp. 9AZ]|uniref:transketolase n=1 Tax=Pseudomonas sp. 9AZ TaxID=2653168 RepID=UPI002113E1FC|nr:transketolase [Pseudomonas sp. 9AZ]
MNPENILERYRKTDAETLRRKAEWLRLEILRLIQTSGLGHYSSSFSAAEVLVTLYQHVLRLKAGEPHWEKRDRFLLGKGHIGVALWPLLAELEFFPASWLDTFGAFDSHLTDHPDMHRAPGIDFSSGSLGHNLSVGLGMALAARQRGEDHRVIVLTGDGELHEGQVWEAVMAAAQHRAGNLIAIVDANGSCGDGHTEEVMSIEPLDQRLRSFGWNCVDVDGHDTAALMRAFADLPAPDSHVPTCIVARTLKGKGVSFMEAAPRDWHLGNLGPKDLQIARNEIEVRLL